MRLARACLAPCLAILLALSLAACASRPSAARAAVAREWYDLGNAWLDKSDWKKAGQAYSRALALDPSLSGASFNLARALTEAGDYATALRFLGTLAARDPGNVRVIAARAYALYKKGDAAAALAAYREALALDPYAADAVYNAALLELAAGDAATAAFPTCLSTRPIRAGRVSRMYPRRIRGIARWIGTNGWSSLGSTGCSAAGWVSGSR